MISRGKKYPEIFRWAPKKIVVVVLVLLLVIVVVVVVDIFKINKKEGNRETYKYHSLIAFLRDQPRPQGLLAFQYGGGRREDPGTQQKSRD